MAPSKVSRPAQFHEFFEFYMDEVRKKYGCRNRFTGTTSWAEGMTRRSARLVARKVARKAMREQKAAA